MKAEAVTIRHLLENRCRYCVPIYQRHYVWDRKNQWEPFWHDVLTKTKEILQNRIQRFPHFMGAVVLESRKSTSVNEVNTFQVVDGQQRLTTFQLFLVAIKHHAIEAEFAHTVQMIDSFLFNGNEHLMENPSIERYKVWPTKYDRELFRDILTGERKDLRAKYEKHFFVTRDEVKYFKTVPELLGAYGYFYEQIKQEVKRDIILEAEDEKKWKSTKSEIASEKESELNRKEILLNLIIVALIQEFKIVQIVLEEGDDAQVIFETLNSRGKPLLATDLVRNNIFQRADAQNEPADELFDKYWKFFEDKFWSEKGRQGRYRKDRIEFFLSHFISAKISGEVTFSKLFSEYKSFIAFHNSKTNGGYPTVESELKDLCKYGSIYRRLIEGNENDKLGNYIRDLKIWEISTLYPLVLRLLAEEELGENEKVQCLKLLTTFIVRRAICDLTSKNYNKFFIYVLRYLDDNQLTYENLASFLTRQTVGSSRFPTDNEFKKAWLTNPVYEILTSQKLKVILESIEQLKRQRFHETNHLADNLTIEHIMPQSWYNENWPLSDGKIVSYDDIIVRWKAQFINEDNSFWGKISRRERLVDTIGNLTILTQALNSSISNGPYSEKCQALNEHSLLVLNREIVKYNEWGESQIENRGNKLFDDALKIWPYPSEILN